MCVGEALAKADAIASFDRSKIDGDTGAPVLPVSVLELVPGAHGGEKALVEEADSMVGRMGRLLCVQYTDSDGPVQRDAKARGLGSPSRSDYWLSKQKCHFADA